MEERKSKRGRDAVLQSLELRPVKLIPSILERLFPLSDAPDGTRIAAQDNWEPKISETTGLLREMRLLLQENRRQLTHPSTPEFDRASVSDRYTPLSPEDACALENLSRRAQAALRAQTEELKQNYDTEFESSEVCLEKSILAALEWLSAPAAPSANGMVAALTRLLGEERRLLREIRQHRRLLWEKPGAILAWENMPDVLIPVTLEEQQLFEEVS